MGDANATARRRRQTPRDGFSMVETLVVIGVITVVVGVLIPVVGRARSSARTAVCASQLHQVYLAAQGWRQDNTDGSNVAVIPAVGWRTAFRPYLRTSEIYICPEDTLIGGTDAAGLPAPSPTPPAAAPAPVTPPPPAAQPPTAPAITPPADTSGHVHGPAATYDWDLDGLMLVVRPGGGAPAFEIPIKPGPLARVISDVPVNGPGTRMPMVAGGYTLGFEDAQGGAGNTDFGDIVLALTDSGKGFVMMTLISKNSTCKFDLSWPDAFLHGSTGLGTDIGNPGTMYEPGSAWIFPGWLQPLHPDPPAPPVVTVVAPPSPPPAPPTAGTPGFSTDSSYGLNGAADGVFGDAEKVFGLDYTTSVADVVDNWLTAPYALQGNLVFARHTGRVNVLYGDGSVRLRDNPKRLLDPAVGENAPKVWRP